MSTKQTGPAVKAQPLFLVRAYNLGDDAWTVILATDDGKAAMQAQNAAKGFFCVEMSRTDSPPTRLRGFSLTDPPRDHYIASHSRSDPEGEMWTK
jgi:hypothetical protein